MLLLLLLFFFSFFICNFIRIEHIWMLEHVQNRSLSWIFDSIKCISIAIHYLYSPSEKKTKISIDYTPEMCNARHINVIIAANIVRREMQQIFIYFFVQWNQSVINDYFCAQIKFQVTMSQVISNFMKITLIISYEISIFFHKGLKYMKFMVFSGHTLIKWDFLPHEAIYFWIDHYSIPQVKYMNEITTVFLLLFCLSASSHSHMFIIIRKPSS